MCLDDGCDEFLCCLCAPLAAIFCCKLCKDKMASNDVGQAPRNDFYPQPDPRAPAPGNYGLQGYDPRMQNRPDLYSGSPRPYPLPERQAFQQNYFPPQQGPMRSDLSAMYVKHQPQPY